MSYTKFLQINEAEIKNVLLALSRLQVI